MSLKPRTSHAKEPYTVYLYQLLDDMRRGELRLPRFQRPFVWEPQARLALLRSIHQGLPIGAVMLWDTSRLDIASWERVGPHPLPQTAQTPRRYVLDGTQRLTTLLAALIDSDDLRQEQREEWWFGYDAEKDEFVPWSERPDSRLLPSTALLNVRHLDQWRRANAGKLTEAQLDRADDVSRAFREYKVAVIPIATESLSDASDVLYQVNSRGTHMSGLHMLHAKLYGQDLDLLRLLERARERLRPVGWESVEDEEILRVLQLLIGLDANEQDVERLTRKLKEQGESARPLTDRAADGLVRAARLLRERCQVAHPSVLPYGTQAVLIGAVLAELEPTVRQEEKLTDWFWLTSYWGTLFGRPKVRPVFKHLQQVCAGLPAEWPQNRYAEYKPLPEVLRGFSARPKALALALAGLHPRHADGRTFDAADALARLRADGLARLIPVWKDGRGDDVQAEDAGTLGADDRPSLSSPGNRLLAPPDGLQELRALLLERPQKASPEVLASHHILERAHACLLDGDLQGFIRQRHQDLVALERERCEAARRRFFDEGGGPP